MRRRILLVCGILSSLVYVAANVVGALRWSGYQSFSQTISELSAIGAPSRSAWIPLGIAYDVLVIAFGFGVWASADRRRATRAAAGLLIAIGTLGAFWPPMHLRGSVGSLTDILHIVFAAMTSLLILLCIGFGATVLGKRFRIYSIATVAALVVFGALSFAYAPRLGANLPTPGLGLIERINVGSYLLWVAVLAIGLLRPRPAAVPRRLPIPASIAVLYATREGQTRKIATRFAGDLRAQGCAVELHDLREGNVALDGAIAVVLAASVHLGRHEKEMAAFVRAHRAELERVPTLFLSVSLSEAGAEMPDRAPEVRAKAAAEVRAVAEKFFTATAFRPTHLLPVAGALAYRHYNMLVRFIMKKIAAAEGASTDTTREHEYTNWAVIDATAESFAREVTAARPC